jgi:hypothetical protein
MSPKLAAEQVRLASLMLPAVDCLLRAMKAENVQDPPTTLRLLAVRNPDLPPDAVSVRYGPMLATIRATFQFQGNDVLVETAIEKCIEIVESLL